MSKKSFKRARTDSNNFKSVEVDMAYNDCYKRAIIIMEWVVKLETLEDTCVPEVFKERTRTKLLNQVELCTWKSLKNSSLMLVWKEII